MLWPDRSVTKLGEYRPVFQPLARYIGDFIGTLRTSDYDLRKVHEICANGGVLCGAARALWEGKLHLTVKHD